MKVWHSMFGISLLAVATAAGAQSSESANGEEAGIAAQADGGHGETVEYSDDLIIVTAQRRDESLQDVPLAITVINGEAIRETGANQLQDITQRAPSLSFTATPGVPNFAIRGVGTNTFDYGVEAAVGIAVDDVNVTLPRFVPLNSLADVARVEVLRGPQGLLFGKNTTAGLISITTNKPQIGEAGVRARLQYGSRDQVQAQGVVNLPLGNTAALRLVGGKQYQSTVTQVVGPAILTPPRRFFGTAKLLWEPSDRFSLYAIVDYLENSGIDSYSTIRRFGGNDPTPIPGFLRRFAPADFVIQQNTALGVIAGPTNNRTAIGSEDVRRDERSFGAQLTASYDAGPMTITSVTAYRDLKSFANNDVDQTPIPFFDVNIARSQSYQVSEELRLSNTDPGPLSYTLGAYYQHQKIDAHILQAGTFGVLPAAFPVRLSPINGQSNFNYRTNSFAAFAQFGLEVAPSLTLIAGARYTRDEIESVTSVTQADGICNLVTFLLSGGQACVGALAPPLFASRNADGFSAKAGVEYALGSAANLYATYTRGYKGPAISVGGGTAFNVDAETVDAYEIGAKIDVLDRALSLNLAAFINEYKDFQAQVYDPALNGGLGAFRTGNANSLSTRGVEIEARVRPLDQLRLTGGVTYLDTEYGDYQIACFFGQTAAEGCNLPGPSFNADGLPLVGASKWTTTLAADFQQPVSNDLKVFLNADWRYRSQFTYAIGNPNAVQPGYSLVNAAFGIGDVADRIRVSVFVRNLFDKQYASTIFVGNFAAGQYVQNLPDDAFRRIGAALEFEF